MEINEEKKNKNTNQTVSVINRFRITFIYSEATNRFNPAARICTSNHFDIQLLKSFQFLEFVSIQMCEKSKYENENPKQNSHFRANESKNKLRNPKRSLRNKNVNIFIAFYSIYFIVFYFQNVVAIQ